MFCPYNFRVDPGATSCQEMTKLQGEWCSSYGTKLLPEGCLHLPLPPCIVAMQPDITVFPHPQGWLLTSLNSPTMEGSDEFRIQDVLRWDSWILLGNVTLSFDQVLGFTWVYVCWELMRHLTVYAGALSIKNRVGGYIIWGCQYNRDKVLAWDMRYGRRCWSSWIWGAVVNRRLGSWS